jgi:hypothetical protein
MYPLSNNKEDNDYREIKKNLNKLTNQNFDDIFNILRSIKFKNKDHLSFFVNIIVNRAIAEPNFCNEYSLLCDRFKSLKISSSTGEDIKFIDLLLMKCQSCFDICTSLELDFEDKGDNTIFKNKKNILGCMTFIGELYNRDIISKNIIVNCFNVLLVKINLNKAYIIESICGLVKQINTKYNKECPNEMNTMISKLDKIKNDLPLQKKFALMDIIELNEQ